MTRRDKIVWERAMSGTKDFSTTRRDLLQAAATARAATAILGRMGINPALVAEVGRSGQHGHNPRPCSRNRTKQEAAEGGVLQRRPPGALVRAGQAGRGILGQAVH